MKIKLGQKIYDTEKAVEVGRRTAGYFGDTTDFEEILFFKGQKVFFSSHGAAVIPNMLRSRSLR